jgi:TATA-box binding protein (TBP) (component of TFIID and TFIIIB)
MEINNTKEIIRIPFPLSVKVHTQNQHQYIDNSIYELQNLPENLTISTISASGKLNKCVNLDNIFTYTHISCSNILSVKYNGKARGITIKKKRVKKNNKKESEVNTTIKTDSSFENQLTMVVHISDAKNVNLKIFNNGAFQMTGCKNVNECNMTINKLIDLLNMKISVFDAQINRIVDKLYLYDYDTPLEIKHFQVDMINTSTNIDYIINRDALYALLLSKKIKCRYEPCNHPGVNIKYTLSETTYTSNSKKNKVKPATIMVFRSGKIIITSVKNKRHLQEAYDYIMKLLTEYKNIIIKEDIDDILTEKDRLEIMLEYEALQHLDTLVNDDEEDNIIV